MKRQRAFLIVLVLMTMVFLVALAACHQHHWENGFCTECGVEHSPHTYNEFGICTVCGAQKPVEDDFTYAEGTEIRMGVTHNSTSTTITYGASSIVGEGLTLADGKTYYLNDLKPVWAELQNRLNVTFNNVYTGATSAQNEYKAWQAKGFKGVDVVVGNASDITADGKNGLILDLSKYLEYMPNFSRFLNDNPIVYLSLISDTDTGAIYYSPYFDGYDDIEKYYLMRTDWVEKLLDGEGEFTATTYDVASATVYTPYMPLSGKLEIESLTADRQSTQIITKNYDTEYGNIVEYMNNMTEKNGVTLVNALRNYIDAAYTDANGAPIYGTKRSDLFTGYNAAWDADELVALLRCVVTNTFTLTGQNSIKVTGIFPRETTLNRTSDLLSLVSLFGVRGYESRHDWLYFDSEGNVVDARGQEDFSQAVSKLNELYREGLILQDFDNASHGTIYKTMYEQNLGFMIYDYVQTQTLYNNTVDIEGFNLAPVMNPVAKWYDGTDENGVWMRFTESWRSVKTNGWCIPAEVANDPDKLHATITMFDYMFSEEGNILMSYGPDAWIEHDNDGNIVTINYKGEEIPKMSQAALDELWNISGGNYTNYARQITGSTLPIGFVKDQGFEYQCTSEGGQEGALKVAQAIALGTVKHVSPEMQENMFYMMMPTVLPTTANDDTYLEQLVVLQNCFSKTKGEYNVWIELIKVGFGSGATLTSPYITKAPETPKALAEYINSDDVGGKSYVMIKDLAWDDLLEYYNTHITK